MTTTFSQGAVFYAGETISCTIAFTNPLPTLPRPPSASSSSSSTYSRRSSTRFQQQTTRHLQGNANSHSRSQSVSSTSELGNMTPKQAIRQSKRASRDLEAFMGRSTVSSPSPPGSSRTATTTLSSLASSTFSFFTGRQDTSKQEQEEDDDNGQRNHWEQGKVVGEQVR